MRSIRSAAFLAVFTWVAPAALADGVMGTFLGPGTYASPEGCRKIKALEAGAPRNVSSVPETLTAEGFESWEGGCEFLKITEVEKSRRWQASMACNEGPEETVEIDTFTRNADGSFNVQVEGDEKISHFVLCE